MPIDVALIRQIALSRCLGINEIEQVKLIALLEPVLTALTEVTDARITSSVSETAQTVAQVNHNFIFSGDTSTSPQLFYTAASGFYVAYITHYVTSTSASAGTAQTNFGFTDGSGAKTVVPAANLTLSGLNSQNGQVGFFAAASSSVTWDTDVTGFGTGTAAVTVKIKLIRVA